MDQALTWEALEQEMEASRRSREEEHERLLSQIPRSPRVLPPPRLHHGAATAPLLIAQQAHHDGSASPSSDRLALVPVGMDDNTSDEALCSDVLDLDTYSSFDPFCEPTYSFDSSGDGNNTWEQSQLRTFLQRLAASPTSSSRGRHGRNGGGDIILPAYALQSVRRFCNELARVQAHRAAADPFDAEYDVEERRLGDRVTHLLPAVATATSASGGGPGHAGGGATPPVPEPSEAASNALEGVFVQAFAACLPSCVMVYPVIKDAPNYVKLAIFGGLAFITVGLFAGILARTVARRRLAMRLVSFLAIAVLTFSTATQLSGPKYISLAAFVGVVVNVLLLLLRFRLSCSRLACPAKAVSELLRGFWARWNVGFSLLLNLCVSSSLYQALAICMSALPSTLIECCLAKPGDALHSMLSENLA